MKKYKMTKEEYFKKYPDYCTNCNGYGGWETKTPVFERNGCPECFEKQICPRCGNHVNDLFECETCEWKIGTDGVPN